MLLETVIDVTADESWPSWLSMLVGLVIGAATPWLAKRGIRVVKKSATKAVATTTTSLLALALLSGCALFDATKMDSASTAANVKAWHHFRENAARWMTDARYSDAVREAHFVGIDEAVKLAESMDRRARE